MSNVDQKTADAFASSWNNLPTESVYTYDQFVDWFAPLTEQDINQRQILELGCGNGSLMTHLLRWQPQLLVGVDLGDSVLSAEKNLASFDHAHWQIVKHDLVTYNGGPFDVVYSIGVLHHLKDPQAGFASVLQNTKSGGKFHCWVYAHEGNAVIRWIVDPLRKLSSRLPWWVTKYFIATPLVAPYFLYAKGVQLLDKLFGRKYFVWLPLYDYSLWIAKRDFLFFRHVAFDQLVTPQTIYLKREQISAWLNNDQIDQSSTYIIFRNGNSWKFGGRKK